MAIISTSQANKYANTAGALKAEASPFVESQKATNAVRELAQSLASPQKAPASKELQKTPTKLSSPFGKLNEDKLNSLPEETKSAIESLVANYGGQEVFINEAGDRLVMNIPGENIKNNLFDNSMFSGITNFFGSLFGRVNSSIGLETYKKYFYNDGNHFGEDPATLIQNLSHTGDKDGGHYYGQVSFQLEDYSSFGIFGGKRFKPDTITISDSAQFAAESLIANGVIEDKSIVDQFKKSYLLKYIIPIDADPAKTSLTQKTEEIVDALLANKPEYFDRFFMVGGPKSHFIDQTHNFASLNWEFPLNEQGKWMHSKGHLNIIRPKDKAIELPKGLAEVVAEMQTSAGENNRHADEAFFKESIEKNKQALTKK